MSKIKNYFHPSSISTNILVNYHINMSRNAFTQIGFVSLSRPVFQSSQPVSDGAVCLRKFY